MWILKRYNNTPTIKAVIGSRSSKGFDYFAAIRVKVGQAAKTQNDKIIKLLQYIMSERPSEVKNRSK